MCWEALQGAAAAAAAAALHTLSGFQLNENNAASRHMTTPPLIKQHLHSLFKQQSTLDDYWIIDYLLSIINEPVINGVVLCAGRTSNVMTQCMATY